MSKGIGSGCKPSTRFPNIPLLFAQTWGPSEETLSSGVRGEKSGGVDDVPPRGDGSAKDDCQVYNLPLKGAGDFFPTCFKVDFFRAQRHRHQRL